MKKIILSLKFSRGSVIIYTLIVLIIVVLLGTTLVTIASVSTNMSALNKNRTQAYYTARSAVEMTMNYINNNITDPVAVGNVLPSVGQPAILSNINTATGNIGTYRLCIERIDASTAIVTATAKVNGQSATVAAKVNISFLIPEGYGVVDNYVGFLTSSTYQLGNVIFSIPELSYVNFNWPGLTYTPDPGIIFNSLNTSDYNNITASNWDTAWNSTNTSFTAGGTYKYTGDIQIGQQGNGIITWTIGDNDVFLFLNGSFLIKDSLNMIKQNPSSSGTFFLVFVNTFDMKATGSESLNEGVTEVFFADINQNVDAQYMANFFVYGPNTNIDFKGSKYNFKGAFITKSFTATSQNNNFFGGYLNKNGVSPWVALFDRLTLLSKGPSIPPVEQINNLTWREDVTVVPFQ